MISVTVTQDLDACFALRREVFIEEQNVPEAEEWDDLDATSTHLLATLDGAPVGTARLIQGEGYGKIGRVCIRKPARGTGLGAVLMRAAIQHFRDNGTAEVRLSAQTYALSFYEGLGFVAHGPEYDDAGIPHRDMVLTL